MYSEIKLPKGSVPYRWCYLPGADGMYSEIKLPKGSVHNPLYES